jgi:uncharacterized protein
MNHHALIVFTRSPEEEAVAKPLHAVHSEAVHRLFLRHTLSVARQASSNGVCDVMVAVSGRYDNAHDEQILPQEGTTFGERLHSVLHCARQQGYTSVVVIGTDSPDITPAILANAFASLELTDVVLGPANDGGVYLLGVRTDVASLDELCTGVHWQTGVVYDELRENCHTAALRVSVFPPLNDIDTQSDLLLHIAPLPSTFTTHLHYTLRQRLLELVCVVNTTLFSRITPTPSQTAPRIRLRFQKAPPVAG